MSKWRSQNVRVQPGNVDTIYFERNPELPNSLYVTNRSSGRLYIGVDKVPSENYYDLLLEPMESNIVCRPFAIGRIMVLNTSNDFADIMVYSDSVDFDFSLLKSKIEVSISDVKKGTLFDVMHDGLNALNSCIKNGRILTKEHHGITAMGSGDMLSIGGKLPNGDDIEIEEINLLVNDGDVDVKIVIDDNFETNLNYFILKPGEIINNLNLNSKKIIAMSNDENKVASMRWIIRYKEVY